MCSTNFFLINIQVNWDKELDEEAERQRRRKKENSKTSNNQAILPPVKKSEVVPQLPKPKSSVSPKLNRANNSATLDLLGLGIYFFKHILHY